MTSNFRQIAVSSLGALALSATCVFAAVGPARAVVVPQTRADWARAVQGEIAAVADTAGTRFTAGRAAEASVKVRFDAAGAVSDVALDRSTGSAGLDAHALAVARRLRYPAMPAAMRGTAQSVTMRLVFGDSDSQVATYLAQHAPAGARYAADTTGKAITE